MPSHNFRGWIGSLKREYLNHFGCFSLGHLDHVVQADVAFHYRHRPHQGRPHQSMNNRPLTASDDPILLRATESPPGPERAGDIKRDATLSGLLNHDKRQAA